MRAENIDSSKILSPADAHDTDAVDVPVAHSNKHVHLNVANDLSFIYTTRPIPHKSGSSYSYKAYVGQRVQVAYYKGHKCTLKPATIIGRNVTVMVGLVALQSNLVLDTNVDPGASGGAVIDKDGNVLGMIILTGTIHAQARDIDATVALPINVIAKTLEKLDPTVGGAIFGNIAPDDEIPPVAATFTYQDTDLPEDTTPVIPTLASVHAEIPNAVERLRSQAALAAETMKNMIAKQCVVQGNQKALCHELSVADGSQVYRKIRSDGKLGRPTDSFPTQRHGVWSQSDWADALEEVAENSWNFQGSLGTYYLFTSDAKPQDDRCYWEEYSQGTPLFGGGHGVWKGSVACSEKVVTDKDFNVMAIYAEQMPPDTCMTRVLESAMYFEWVHLEGTNSPMLLPVMERLGAKVTGQKELWFTAITWSDYRHFGVSHTITIGKTAS